MARYELVYRNTTWWLIDNEGEPYVNETIVGHALDVQLLRDGPDVLITSDTIGCPKSRIIPSDTIIKGLGSELEGKTLWEVTDTGTVYNRIHSIRR